MIALGFLVVPLGPTPSECCQGTITPSPSASSFALKIH